jgi:formyl-CoA transferase
MTLPLSGLLVGSLEQTVAAPMCTCRLADAGARVIKVERPEGDFARGYDDLVHGESAYFVWLNTSPCAGGRIRRGAGSGRAL